MRDKLKLLSYTLAAMAGVCLLSGIAILSEGVEEHGPTRTNHISAG